MAKGNPDPFLTRTTDSSSPLQDGDIIFLSEYLSFRLLGVYYPERSTYFKYETQTFLSDPLYHKLICLHSHLHTGTLAFRDHPADKHIVSASDRNAFPANSYRFTCPHRNADSDPSRLGNCKPIPVQHCPANSSKPQSQSNCRSAELSLWTGS